MLLFLVAFLLFTWVNDWEFCDFAYELFVGNLYSF